MMTQREVFEKVKTHLLTQKRKSVRYSVQAFTPFAFIAGHSEECARLDA